MIVLGSVCNTYHLGMHEMGSTRQLIIGYLVYGRVSNALVESYFSIVKDSILKKKTRLRPMSFLMEMYLHTESRFKAEKFGVSQRSSSRKAKREKSHDLNVKEVWSKRGRSNSSPTRRGVYFNDEVSQTNAYKLS